MRDERGVRRLFNRIGNVYVSADFMASELNKTRREIEYMVMYNPEMFECTGIGDLRKYRLAGLDRAIKPKKSYSLFVREVCYDFVMVNDGATLHDIARFLGMKPRYAAKILYKDHRLVKRNDVWVAR